MVHSSKKRLVKHFSKKMDRTQTRPKNLLKDLKSITMTCLTRILPHLIQQHNTLKNSEDQFA